jgi:solute carrier family 66 (lysosomal lysine-arginine transporter), member 1
VLQYLCHNRYVATAKAFARDSAVRHLDLDGDEIMLPEKSFAAGRLPELTSEALSLIELRERESFDTPPIKVLTRRAEVRTYILSGQAETAIDFLNTRFPSVLSKCQRIPPSTSDDIKYISPTSVVPAHLNLNLRILAFIEECRTIPLPYPCTPEPPIPLHIQFPTDSEIVDNHQANLLTRLEKLYSLVNILEKPEERAVFLQELDLVRGLLAYPVPESSTVRQYLSPTRREAVAAQIDRAILCA